jgi:hypothetical protein
MTGELTRLKALFDDGRPNIFSVSFTSRGDDIARFRVRCRREVIDFGHRLSSLHAWPICEVGRKEIGLLSRREGRERGIESRLRRVFEAVVL